MLKYAKSRKQDALDITIDGKKLEVHEPGVRRMMNCVLEYVDTLKYIPRHLDLNKQTAGSISKIIVQSFSDIFRGYNGEPARSVYEHVSALTQNMITQIQDILSQSSIVPRDKFQETCKIFIPAALLKLQNDLFTDLSQ